MINAIIPTTIHVNGQDNIAVFSPYCAAVAAAVALASVPVAAACAYDATHIVILIPVDIISIAFVMPT